MTTLHAGSIVRVTGKAGDWRVLPGEGLSLGTHERQLCVEAVGKSWIKRLSVPISAVHLALVAGLGSR